MPRARRRYTTLWLVGLVGLGIPAGSAQAQERCMPWPGEMDPLPTTQSADPFEARWATLRARELETIASALQREQPVMSQRLRMHARCLDPRVDAGAEPETEPVLLRPSVAYRSRPVLRQPEPEPVNPAPQEPRGNYAEVDRAIAEAETEIAGARFQIALDRADDARALLGEQPDGAARRERTAQLEVLAATALVALGRSGDASDSFARALRAQPDLELDETTTPPKILRLFMQVRERSAGQLEDRP